MKGYVKKRKDGRWQGRVELPPDMDGNRRQKYVYADGRAECRRLVNEIIYKLQTSDFADAGRLTVEAYLDKWYKTYCTKLAASTRQGYRNYVYNHITPHFHNYKLKDLRPIHIEEFYNCERKKYKEKTVLQAHAILSRALTDAVRNNLITKNPCKLVDSPSPPEYPISVPSMELFWDMVVAAEGTEHLIPILLAGLCGLRREEIFGLTWNDIDFDNATLTVRQVVTTAREGLDIKIPKTKLSARTISIPDPVLEVLSQNKSVGYVMSKNGKVAHPGHYSHRFKNFIDTNKFPSKTGLHKLRHFHATLLLDAGVPLKYAQSRLGHSNINMTAHYQHLTKKADVIVIEKIHAHINRKNISGGQSEGQT